MKRRNLALLIVCSMLFSFSFIACNDDDDEDKLLVPAKAVFNLSFEDTDEEEGKMGGTLTWKLPDSETNIDEYIIYVSESSDKKETEIGKVSKGSQSFEVPKGTAYKPNILVVAKNAVGESNNIAYVSVADYTGEPKPELLKGVFIMNAGKWKENNATLDYYDPNTKEVTTKVFSTENGRGLGDTANDMVIYGSKMYIAVNTSATIEITDLNGKSLKTLSPKDDEGQPQQPRRLDKYNGEVFVTLFDGYVAAIDTTTLEIANKVKVGPNPEGVKAVDGKLYVANSGGYNPVPDSTLSVVDIKTFKVEKEIVVGVNPEVVLKDSEGDLYIHTQGNYVDIPAQLVRVNLETEEKTVILTNQQLKPRICNDKVYIIGAEFDENYAPTNVKFSIYDAKTESLTADNLITDGTEVKAPSSISVDPVTGNIFIGSGSYTSTGDVFIFSPEGKKLHQFETSGINVMGAYFISDNK